MTEYERALKDAHDVVNSLGGVASSPSERDYCRGLDEVLWAIEALQAEHGTKKIEAQLEAILTQIRRPYNGFLSPQESDK
jgi:hypothetical protein